VRAPLGLVLLAACAAPPPPGPPDFAIVEADEAAAHSDWAQARRALEEAAFDRPDDPVVALRLARMELEAFAEVDRAQRRYERLPRELRARALHGLGRCALWRGDEEHALALFRDSLREKPTTACAKDLALRLLARGEPADEALDLVVALSGDTLRSRLLLAAAGRAPRPERLPEGWTYALERARLVPLEAARAEVDLYLERACATEAAREAMARVLALDPALRRPSAEGRNPPSPPAVK
jgi:tetratricopeptide (TPR) repeat protein